VRLFRGQNFFHVFIFFLYIMLDIKKGFVRNVFKRVSKESFAIFLKELYVLKKGE